GDEIIQHGKIGVLAAGDAGAPLLQGQALGLFVILIRQRIHSSPRHSPAGQGSGRAAWFSAPSYQERRPAVKTSRPAGAAGKPALPNPGGCVMVSWIRTGKAGHLMAILV